jgi:hypothetical protein
LPVGICWCKLEFVSVLILTSRCGQEKSGIIFEYKKYEFWSTDFADYQILFGYYWGVVINGL